MLKLYDTVKIKSTGQMASIIEIDDNNGTAVPIYLVELHDKKPDAEITDVIMWVEDSEIEKCVPHN